MVIGLGNFMAILLSPCLVLLNLAQAIHIAGKGIVLAIGTPAYSKYITLGT